MGEYSTAFAKAPIAGFDIGIDTVLAKRGGHGGIYGRDYGLGLHRLLHLPGNAEIGGDFQEMRVLAGRGENKDVDIPAGQAAGGFLKRANIAGKLPAINLNPAVGAAVSAQAVEKVRNFNCPALHAPGDN